MTLLRRIALQLIGFAFGLCAAGGGSAQAPNPVPSITVLAPTSVIASPVGRPFDVTVSGTNFMPGSRVRWNGVDLPTTFGSSTSLVATVLGRNFSSGVHTVTVFNPAPGGGNSNGLSFTVENPVPVISGPPNWITTTEFGETYNLEISGSGFVGGSVVRWNGADRPSFARSPMLIRARIPASDLASAGVATVTVSNAAPGGGSSNGVTITILNPTAITTFTGPSATGSGNVTAAFTGGGPGCTYAISQQVPLSGHASSPPAGSAPLSLAFPHGLFDFTVGGCTPGATITMTITYPAPLPPGTNYWKFGPTPGNLAPHWYTMPATIAGNTVTFNIVDGQLGDDDLVANGTIVDQGGPGVPGAGVGAEVIPTLSDWALILLSALILLAGTPAVGRRLIAPRG